MSTAIPGGLARVVGTLALGLVACADDPVADRDPTEATLEASAWPTDVLLGDTLTLRVQVTDVEAGVPVDPAALAWTVVPAHALEILHAAGDSAVVRADSLGALELTVALQDAAFEPASTTGVLDAHLAGVSVTVIAGDTLRSIGDTLFVRARGIDGNGDLVSADAWVWTVRGDAAGIAQGAAATDSVAVVALANGRTWIVASHPTCATTCRDSVAVDVHQRAASLTLTPDSTHLHWIGDSLQASASAHDSRGNPIPGAVTWTSSDGDVATVDASGLVTATGTTTHAWTGLFGTALVIAGAGDLSDTLHVRVTRFLATVELSTTAATLAPGDTLRIVATQRDSGGTVIEDAYITWQSTDTLVATVQRWCHLINQFECVPHYPATGRITARAPGVSTIRATANGVLTTATVTVVAHGGSAASGTRPARRARPAQHAPR